MSMMHCSLLSLGCAFGFTPPAEQSVLTGLRALKIAQRRLRPEVRSKLLSITSARTDQTLLPEAWRFVFLDAGTSGNCRVVTVAAKASSEHPDTIEAFSAMKTDSAASMSPIPQNKLLFDSNQALEQVRLQSKLKNVRAAEYHLSQQAKSTEPAWMIRFLDDKGELLAKYRVGAKTGTTAPCNGEKEK